MNVYLHALSWKLGCEKAFTIIHSANLTATIPSFSGSECVVSSALLLEYQKLSPKIRIEQVKILGWLVVFILNNNIISR